MAAVDDLVGRLVGDPAFREEFRACPGAALATFGLTADDLSTVALVLDTALVGRTATERRLSKALVFQALVEIGG